MIEWIKRKLGITQVEQDQDRLQDHINMMRSDIFNHERFVSDTMAELRRYIKVDADIGDPRCEENTIIVTGRFNGRGFVKFYDMGEAPFSEIVKQLDCMSKYAEIRNIYKPYTMHQVFNY